MALLWSVCLLPDELPLSYTTIKVRQLTTKRRASALSRGARRTIGVTATGSMTSFGTSVKLQKPAAIADWPCHPVPLTLEANR